MSVSAVDDMNVCVGVSVCESARARVCVSEVGVGGKP